VAIACIAMLAGMLPAAAAEVSGPVPGTPGAGAVGTTTFPLGVVGYEQSEFFLSGEASSYVPMAGSSFQANGQWTVTPAATADFTTRLTVFRPSDPADFNGTVLVEWLNVTNQVDLAPDWIMAHNEIVRDGSIWIGVSAQAVGVNAAKNREPQRYASLLHPGDSFSYDIFRQAGEAIRDDADVILGGLTPDQVIAMGESQSAGRMVTYINAIHPRSAAYDGYLVHSRGAAGAALSNSSATTVAIATPAPTLVRDDLDVPVLVLQAEDDVVRSFGSRQSDTPLRRLWEVAGSAHADNYVLGIGQADIGDGAGARAMFARMLDPTREPLPGAFPACPFPVNAGPHHWVVKAAIHHLIAWVADGTPPPIADRIAYDGVQFALDAHGNVLGGVRSPHVDAPVATLRGPGNVAPGTFCTLFGTTEPFSATKLAQLYRNHGQFVRQWSQATNAAVAAGFILEADSDDLKGAAAESGVGKRR
jgi:hypothetical protein